jgi:hypothetical protein
MKKHIGFILTAAVIVGCADTKKQEKLLLDSVIAVHDKVMANDGHLMNNKMLLDSLVKNKPTAKDSAIAYLKIVDGADSVMGDWMHNFDIENKGKSHQEIIDYLNDQRKKIGAIDSQINQAITQSDRYLNQNKK